MITNQYDEQMAFESLNWEKAPSGASDAVTFVFMPILVQMLENLEVDLEENKIGFACDLKMGPGREVIRMDIIIVLRKMDWQESAVIFIPCESLEDEDAVCKTFEKASQQLCNNVKKFIDAREEK